MYFNFMDLLSFDGPSDFEDIIDFYYIPYIF